MIVQFRSQDTANQRQLIVREKERREHCAYSCHKFARPAYFQSDSTIILEQRLQLPRIGNGFVMMVSVVGGSSRCVSGDITLGHKFNSCFLLSLLLFTPPRSRSDGDPLATSICVRYRSMTERRNRVGPRALATADCTYGTSRVRQAISCCLSALHVLRGRHSSARASRRAGRASCAVTRLSRGDGQIAIHPT